MPLSNSCEYSHAPYFFISCPWRISYTTKLTFHRPRPHLWDLFYRLPSDCSFPSGHALSSMTLVVILVALTWGSRWCKWGLLFGSLFVLTIGWTRLYLGIHYPSDILGGWLLGISWGIGVSLLVKPRLDQLGIERRQKNHKDT
jgi:undecaprenyl-diphosphatase